ncbi:hypothetical protein AB0C61_18050 [Streptomyces sp. NPDC048680]|uniref:hypothetical protein n=1 Tax=Streptomyces sp. NPDC048680 TaxID=3155492 RepID=UPI00343F4ABA
MSVSCRSDNRAAVAPRLPGYVPRRLPPARIDQVMARSATVDHIRTLPAASITLR